MPKASPKKKKDSTFLISAKTRTSAVGRGPWLTQTANLSFREERRGPRKTRSQLLWSQRRWKTHTDEKKEALDWRKRPSLRAAARACPANLFTNAWSNHHLLKSNLTPQGNPVVTRRVPVCNCLHHRGTYYWTKADKITTFITASIMIVYFQMRHSLHNKWFSD